jgi:lysophospholipase L1-like esterase
VYPEQVKFYKEIYGEQVMNDNWLYYVTTDGCHPNRVGMSLIADALVGPVGSVLGR